MRTGMGTLTFNLLVCLVLVAPARPALADACDETPDCPEGQVCKLGECLDVPEECATFCENMSPCFSGGGTECTGGGRVNDAGEMGEIVEECHPYDGPTKDLMDDCLSDCADAMGDDEAQAFMAGLISCMEEAGYDCSARSACAAQAGGGAGYIEGEDVDSKAGEEGSDGDVANGGATGATSTGTGESNSSCSMSGPPQPLPMGPVILLCLAALTVLAVRDSRQRSKGK